MSVMLIILHPSGRIVVSDSMGLLALIPPGVAQAGGFRLYVVDRVGAEEAVGYMDDSDVVRLSPHDWQEAVPISVDGITRTAVLQCRERNLTSSPFPDTGGRP